MAVVVFGLARRSRLALSLHVFNEEFAVSRVLRIGDCTMAVVVRVLAGRIRPALSLLVPNEVFAVSHVVRIDDVVVCRPAQVTVSVRRLGLLRCAVSTVFHVVEV